VGLIETEIAFNQAVAETLEEVQRLYQQLENGRAALANGQLTVAIEKLESTKAAIRQDAFFTNTNVMSILTLEVARFREQIEDTLRLRWQEQLKLDRQRGEFQVVKGDGADSLDNTIASMSRLEILASASEKLLKDLCVAVVDPILRPRADGKSRAVSITDTGIRVQSEFSETTVAETLSRTTEVLDYLRQNLPQSILSELPQSLIPSVASKAISGWLSSSIPTTLNGLGEFEETLDIVMQFTNTVQSWGWTGIEELVSWVNQAPRLWLTRRRVDSLDSVRKVLAASQGTTKQVERVEKEQVSRADEALLETATDDWDANWDDEKGEASTAGPAMAAQPEEEEDVSAWGLDEDAHEEAEPDATGASGDDDADDDAWGWGDDDGEEEPSDRNKSLQTDTASKPVNGAEAAQSSTPREMTLREVYTVTDIPDSILDIVRQQINDSKDISQPP
jgi:centromere/kinetochore protein ZW10